MNHHLRRMLLLFSPLLLAPLAGHAGAWGQIGPWSNGRWDVPPSVYGFALDETGPERYGGARYKEYYAYGWGYALAGFPGPVPNYAHGSWFRYKYWPFDSSNLPGVYDPEKAPGCAYIILQVPENASVWLEGKLTKQTGAVRTYVSPQLPPNQSFVYQVRVKWDTGSGAIEQIRDVTVQAGAHVQVTFAANYAAAPASKTVPVSNALKFRPATSE
jgi:uncharacterized protein (TIGR03000 family)